MALSGKIQKLENGGKEYFTIDFTNGTFTQLKELQTFLKSKDFDVSDDLTDVVRVAISLLVKAKEDKEKENNV